MFVEESDKMSARARWRGGEGVGGGGGGGERDEARGTVEG